MFTIGFPLALVAWLAPPAVGDGSAELSAFFRPPRTSIEIPASGNAIFTLRDVVEEYGAATGIHLMISTDAARLLESTGVGLTGDLSVPASELHAVVGALLHQNGFATSLLHAAEPRLLRVWSPEADIERRPRFLALGSDDRALLEAHPSLLVRVTLELSSVDARSVPGLLRPIAVGPLSSVTALGLHHVALSGRAGEVSEWMSMLEAADRPGDDCGDEPAASPAPAFPASSVDAVALVLEAIERVGADAGAIEVGTLRAKPSGAGTRVLFDVAVSASDVLQATRRFRTVMELLGRRSWCGDLSESASRPTDTGIRTDVTVDVAGAGSDGDVALLDASAEDPSATLLALASRSESGIEVVQIHRRSRSVADGIDEIALGFGSPHGSGAPRSAVLAFLAEIERAAPGSSVADLALVPLDGEQGAGARCRFEARVVWRRAR